jgi:hypothetical protein
VDDDDSEDENLDDDDDDDDNEVEVVALVDVELDVNIELEEITDEERDEESEMSGIIGEEVIDVGESVEDGKIYEDVESEDDEISIEITGGVLLNKSSAVEDSFNVD